MTGWSRATVPIAAALLLAGALPLAADRDFLTTNEADQVRMAQEPNTRLKLYADFARERIDLINHLLSKEEAGRSSLLHETLEDYTKIIETIDIVADDALVRKVDIVEGLAAVAEAEKEFLDVLEGVGEKKPKDIARYRFVLDTAIETTSDSLEVNLEDIGARTMSVKEKQEREQRELEQMMTPEMRTNREADTAEIKKEEKEKKKKAPSLFKKGEKKGKEEPGRKP